MKIIFRAFVILCISSFLIINSLAQTRAQNPPCSEAYYALIIGIRDVNISDSKGGKLVKTGEFVVNTAKGLLDYEPTGENSASLIFDPTATHYIDFQFPNKPIAIDVVKGCGNRHPNSAVRFQDVFLPPNTKVRLILSPQGVSDLNYDRDGDGKLESFFKATARVSGVKAADTEAPKIDISIENHGVYALVTIIAADVSNTQEIRYSLDGTHFQIYKEPFQIKYSEYQTTVFAFADTKTGIRSGLYTKNFRFIPEKRKILTNLPYLGLNI